VAGAGGCCHSGAVSELDPGSAPVPDGVVQAAALLGVPAELLREAIGGPWSEPMPGPAFGHDVTVFTGLENPRVPGRPLVVLRVDHDARAVDVGRAIGVPLPGGRHQWSLGEPRTSIDLDEVPLDEAWGPARTAVLLVEEVRQAVRAVVDAAVLRGTSW
jgi:hypothetical protein